MNHKVQKDQHDYTIEFKRGANSLQLVLFDRLYSSESGDWDRDII